MNNSSPKDSGTTPNNATSSSSTPSWKRGSRVANAKEFSPDTKKTPSPSPGEKNPTELLRQRREERLAQKEESPPPSPDIKESIQAEENNDSSNPLLEVVPTTQEESAETAPSVRSSNLGIYIFLSVCLILLAGAGYMVKKQRETLPPDPYDAAEKAYEETYSAFVTAKLKSLQIEQNKLHANMVESAYSRLIDARGLLETQAKEAEKINEEITSIQDKMLSYYKRYKTVTQKRARGIFLDQLVTRSGKEFFEVSIRECNDRYITIIHADGSTRVLMVDLPDALLDRLAYTNPFADIMEKKKNHNTQTRPQIKAAQPHTQNLPISPSSYDPPSRLPQVPTPTHADIPDSPKVEISTPENKEPATAKEGLPPWLSDSVAPSSLPETETPPAQEPAPTPALDLPGELELPPL